MWETGIERKEVGNNEKNYEACEKCHDADGEMFEQTSVCDK